MPLRGRGRAARAVAAPPQSAVPFWAMMGFTFILFLSPQSYVAALKPLHLALVTSVVAVGAFVFDRFARHLPVVVLHRQNVLLLWLLAWIVLTLPLSVWVGGSLHVLTGLYLKTLIVYWLLSHVITTADRLRRAIWVLTLMSIPIAITALVHLLAGDFIEEGADRIAGYDAPLTSNPNDLALTLNLLLPLAVALLLGNRSPLQRALLLGCICLDAIGIIATFSRGGFITLCVIGLTYLAILFRRGHRQLPFLALFLVLAAVPLLPSGYTDRLSTITNIQADASGSAQDRLTDSIAAVKYVAVHPLIGAGIGQDQLALNQVRGPTWTHVHDIYLEYAVDLGLPGLVLFLLLLLGVLRCARVAQQRFALIPDRGQCFYLAEGIRVSLIAFCVGGLFHPVAYQAFFYFFAGLAMAAYFVSAAETTGAAGTPQRRRRAPRVSPAPPAFQS
jgi:probable O-glycosylation ligase (exosortase A-associated)